MMRKTACLLLLICLVAVSSAYGQQGPRKRQSNKYRVILSLMGAGGGFVLGVFAGIAAFDDSVNASRKITTTAVLTGAAAGVGGYFLGRVLDRRDSTASWSPKYIPNGLDYSIRRVPSVNAGDFGSLASVAFPSVLAPMPDIQAQGKPTALVLRNPMQDLRAPGWEGMRLRRFSTRCGFKQRSGSTLSGESFRSRP